MMRKKVLLFTSTSGAGHNVVASNVKLKFEEAGFETRTIDLFAHDPKIVKLVSGFWFDAMFKLPTVTNLIWKSAKRKETGLYDRLVKKVKDYIIAKINEFEPDIIVSSHIAGQILTYSYGGLINKPFRDYFIITDYEIPPTIKPTRGEESFIVVPTEDFKNELENLGFDRRHLLPFGIPINEKFYKQIDKSEVLTRLALDSFDTRKPTVLMMGGGKGLGKIAGTVSALSKNPDLQIITVCGRNDNLKNKIDSIIKRNAKCAYARARIYNFGFCTNVEELMTVSDYYVGKTGGISATEAVAKGLSLISFRQIPCPEFSNLKYLEGKGLAKGVSNISQLKRLVAGKPEKQEGNYSLVEKSCEKIINHALG